MKSYFEGRAGLFVLSGDAPGGMPSTVIEVVTGAESPHPEGAWKMVRPGAVPASVLDELHAA